MNAKTTCEAIRARLALYLLGDLDARTQTLMADHLRQCAACRADADKLAPTVDRLRDALQAVPEAPAALSADRRKRILSAYSQRPATRTTARKRKPLLLRFHILEMAAVFIGALMIISMLTANFGVKSRSRHAMMRVAKPRMVAGPVAMEMLEEIEALPSSRKLEGERPREPVSGDANGVATISENLSFADATYTESPAPPEPTEVTMNMGADMPSLPTDPAPMSSPHDFKKLKDAEFAQSLNVPIDSALAAQSGPNPPATTAQVQPAEFDSVAMVKSPVILRGVLGSREARAERERLSALQEARDVPVEIVDAPAKPAGGKGWGFEQSDTLRQAENANERRANVADKRIAEKTSGDFISLEGAGVGGGGMADADLDASFFSEMGVAFNDDTAPEPLGRADSTPGSAGAPPAAAMPQSGERAEKMDAYAKADVRSKGGDFIAMEGTGHSQVTTERKMNELSTTINGSPGNGPQGNELSAEMQDDADPFAPRFKAAGVNPFVSAAGQAFSTFSIDVDTASYTVARNYMLGGQLPPPEAVRTEEFVNFFDYAYDPPIGRTFRVAAEIAPSRFGRGLHLLKLGVKGRRLGREEQRLASLTLLIDSSGSMNQPDRLGLVRTALDLLLDELADTDQVAIIQFDNQARLVLAHTPVAEREKIRAALGALQCSGGTNLEAGLQQAYELAGKAFISRGENRILLMSDGVVNLGETAAESITARIEANRRQGLYLSVFGFGMGIYDDAMLKELASKGNGAYAFIDSEQEARRVFVDDLSATLNTIAEDVKIQIEFNPKQVKRYRQLGYEQRQLTKEQFRDDTVDAGEVGSGQSVTALYELDLAAANQPVPYAAQARLAPDADNWLAIARVRYRRVDNGQIEEIEQRISEREIRQAFDDASPRFRLAAGVAAFAEILRGSPYVQGIAFEDVAAVLRPVALDLHLDSRIRELVQMVETASGLAR